MLWFVIVGSFAIWLLAAVADIGGDLNDLLLVIPAAVLLFELRPRRNTAR